MKSPFLAAAAFTVAMAASEARSDAPVPTPADLAFVAKVSEGGMFEVEAGKLAEGKGSTQDVRDFAAMEVHDHTLVGDRLKSISSSEKVALASTLNADFQGKLDHLKTRSGPGFDDAYRTAMATIHAADGAAFAKEGAGGGSPAYRAFGVETHGIVQRHLGAIHAAAPPPAK